MRAPSIGRSLGAGRRWLAGGGLGLLVTGAILSGGVPVAATNLPACTSGSAVDNCLFGGFEIDGNTYDGQGGTDWQSSAVYGSAAYTPFYDLFNTTSDNIMSNGSKESDQTTWSCVTSKPPGKSDLGAGFYTDTLPTGDPGGDPGVAAGEFAPLAGTPPTPWAGSIWFENTTKQFLFGNFQRFATNGDVHLDYEFNKATTKLSSGCTGLPKRSQGDVLITFDTSNGGAQIFVSAFVWSCSPAQTKGTVCTGSGSFAAANNLTAGDTFAGMANIPSGDSGVTSGAYGEAGLNLTDTIGNFTCGEFGSAFMKTRSAGTSDIANGKAEVKDFTTPVPFNPGLCPNSTLAKFQADEGAADTPEDTTGTDATADAALRYNQKCDTHLNGLGSCATPVDTTPMPGSPGDELVYRLDYQNTGGGAAPTPIVQDTVPTGLTYVAGTQSCPSGATCAATDTAHYVSATPCTPSGAATGAITKLAWCLPSEAAGASVSLYFEATVPASSATSSQTFENCGTVSDNSSDTGGGSSNCVAATVNFSPSSSLTKAEADVQPTTQYCNSASSGGAVTSNASCASLQGAASSPSLPLTATTLAAKPGDIIEYELTYTNSGTSPATGVTITDYVPANSTYVASSATCDATCTPATTGTPVTSITWTYASVAVGGTKHVFFKVQLAATFNDGSGNTVSNGGNQTDLLGNPTNGFADVTDDQTEVVYSNAVSATVTATAALALLKSAVVGGGHITYTIKYYNTGNGNLTGVVISDAIPAGLNFVSCSVNGVGTSPSSLPAGCSSAPTVGTNGTVTWTVDALAGTSAGTPAGTVTLVVGP